MFVFFLVEVRVSFTPVETVACLAGRSVRGTGNGFGRTRVLGREESERERIPFFRGPTFLGEAPNLVGKLKLFRWSPNLAGKLRQAPTF